MYYEDFRDSIIKKFEELDRVQSSLEDVEYTMVSDRVMKNMISLGSKFNSEVSSFKTLTYNGEGPPDLRGSKLEQLKDWMNKYNSDPVELMISDLPKNVRKQDLSFDTSTLDRYASYCQKAIDYIETLPQTYESFMVEIEPHLKLAKFFTKEVRHLELKNLDLNVAEDEEITIDVTEITPEKTIHKVESLLKPFGKFITKVEDKKKLIKDLCAKIEEMGTRNDIREAALSKNSKIKYLFSLLSDLRKKINIDPRIKGLFGDRFNDAFEKALKYLPAETASKVGIKSLENIKEFMSKKEAQTVNKIIKIANKFAVKYL